MFRFRRFVFMVDRTETIFLLLFSLRVERGLELRGTTHLSSGFMDTMLYCIYPSHLSHLQSEVSAFYRAYCWMLLDVVYACVLLAV